MIEKRETPSQPLHVTLWAHASSAGECEALIPIVSDHLNREADAKVVFTVFSESGLRPLKKWIESLSQLDPSKSLEKRVVSYGLSPVEGYWKDSFLHFLPKAFLTSRYECWPELWIELSLRSVPLYIIGAQNRSSLRWGFRILRVLGMHTPKIILSAFSKTSEERLKSLAESPLVKRVAKGGVEIRISSDPRWRRVLERAEKESLPERSWFPEIRSLPRPWVILGSVYQNDFRVFFDTKRHSTTIPWPKQGTYFVFPHDENVGDFFEALIKPRVHYPWRHVWDLGVDGHPHKVSFPGMITRTNPETPSEHAIAVLVRKRGVLTEFYREADFVYVGGGFNKGVHSCIEPGIYDVPLYCGMKNIEKFEEIQLLVEQKSIGLLDSRMESGDWKKFRSDLITLQKKKLSDLEKKRGHLRSTMREEFLRAREDFKW